MNNVGDSFRGMLDTMISYIPNIIGALLLLLLAWIIAMIVKGIFTKGLQKAGADRAMVKGHMARDKQDADNKLSSIGRILYFLVFLLFVPPILDQLNMQNVAAPISNMMDRILSFIPNLLLAAFILIIGYFIAKFVKSLVYSLLVTMNIDRWFNKLNAKSDNGTSGGTGTTRSSRRNAEAEGTQNAEGPSTPGDSGTTGTPEGTPDGGEKSTLANVLANVVFIIVLIPIITVALETLNIESISEPIISVLNETLDMIPNIFVAIILILVGYYIAKFISDLLINLLDSVGINRFSGYLSGGKANNTNNINLAKIIGRVVQTIIVIFFVVEALNVLQLEVLNNIGDAIIGYLPLAISSLIILGLGFIGGSLLSNYIAKAAGNRFLGELIKYIIIVIAIFMTLDQLNFATSIVNLAFLFIIAGLAVAFAIAFGIGGREFAKRQLEKFETKMKKDDVTPNTGNTPNMGNNPNPGNNPNRGNNPNNNDGLNR